jgi:hypothetical protein
MRKGMTANSEDWKKNERRERKVRTGKKKRVVGKQERERESSC